MATISTTRIEAQIAKLEALLASQDEMKDELKRLKEAKASLDEIANLLPTRGRPAATTSTGGKKRRGRPPKNA